MGVVGSANSASRVGASLYCVTEDEARGTRNEVERVGAEAARNRVFLANFCELKFVRL